MHSRSFFFLSVILSILIWEEATHDRVVASWQQWLLFFFSYAVLPQKQKFVLNLQASFFSACFWEDLKVTQNCSVIYSTHLNNHPTDKVGVNLKSNLFAFRLVSRASTQSWFHCVWLCGCCDGGSSRCSLSPKVKFEPKHRDVFL